MFGLSHSPITGTPQNDAASLQLTTLHKANSATANQGSQHTHLGPKSSILIPRLGKRCHVPGSVILQPTSSFRGASGSRNSSFISREIVQDQETRASCRPHETTNPQRKHSLHPRSWTADSSVLQALGYVKQIHTRPFVPAE